MDAAQAAAVLPVLVDPAAVAGLTAVTNNFVAATMNSLFMILVTEIGDKTFFIAAILAMRHGRLVVYAGAMGALALMHLISSLMGFALPSLLPRAYTHFASAILFLYFGYKLLRDAYEMDGVGPSEELQEVEEELRKTKGDGKEQEEDGEECDATNGSGGEGDLEKGNTGVSKLPDQNLAAENLKVFTQAFTLTFLAEWGDRSQIATVALAASKNPFGVVLGGLIGHAFCTGLAVIGGKMLAAKISERTVAIIGGILFLIFGVTSIFFGPEDF
uniref:GDT1 family protein n=1 Tax=Spumella elongata TaxID=89044 RepID=A0A7S3HLT5_9STRA|eukprot:CAMPEP_0184989116 /NCGR_PEP_ID=MMETSP1098-20130426/26799_1 /TAXON_ID=89044 /ORGANISM="Spumella elongata, Strain CCAP 955/1" /LENGTH=272 /DNA_ID=CAMNT_0027514031 /DNA_START=47 /DNA_END=865 /DNA_ORIENTATION=+